MDLLSNIKFYYEIEIELKAGPTFYYTVDQYTACYLEKTLLKLQTHPFLVFMIANNTRSVGVRASEIGTFRVSPAPYKEIADYTDNFRAVSMLDENSGEIPTYAVDELNAPDCLLYVNNPGALRRYLSYSGLEPGELAGFDQELGGQVELRKFIRFNGLLCSDEYVSTDSIIVFECDSEVLGIYIPV